MLRKPNPCRRRGVILLLSVASLAIVMILLATFLKDVAMRRRQMRQTLQRLQTSWLVESGFERAMAALAADPAYGGETWRIDAAQLEARNAAEVRIKVHRIPGQLQRRRIVVEAEFPLKQSTRVVREKEFIADAKETRP
jgi:type II secretory pathway component PulK